MKNLNRLVLAITIISTSAMTIGCVHNHVVDGVQEKIEIPEGVKVSIGSKEVKKGDTVNVFRVECDPKRRGLRSSAINECAQKMLGTAKVIEVLDHDLAIIQPENGLVMEQDMKVERQ